MTGVAIIHKPNGISSFDVLRELRKKLNEKKMGYLGTLDPLATGVLVVFIGKATKLIPYYSALDKEYVAEGELGKISDSFDGTGTIEVLKKDLPNEEAFRASLDRFIGPQWQIQPAFSAIKRDGKRSYELAREGTIQDLGKRQVNIYELKGTSFSSPNFMLHIKCSTGTYIRSLIHELGEALGCGAIMTSLKRTAVGDFRLEHALKIEDVDPSKLITVSSVLDNHLPSKQISEKEKVYILQKLKLK